MRHTFKRREKLIFVQRRNNRQTDLHVRCGATILSPLNPGAALDFSVLACAGTCLSVVLARLSTRRPNPHEYAWPSLCVRDHHPRSRVKILCCNSLSLRLSVRQIKPSPPSLLLLPPPACLGRSSEAQRCFDALFCNFRLEYRLWACLCCSVCVLPREGHGGERAPPPCFLLLLLPPAPSPPLPLLRLLAPHGAIQVLEQFVLMVVEFNHTGNICVLLLSRPCFTSVLSLFYVS